MIENEDTQVHQNDEFRAKFKDHTTLQVIHAMDEMRKAKDRAEAELKTINAEYDFVRHILVPEMFERDGIENLAVAGVGRVSLTSDLRVSIASGAKEQAYRFLDDVGKGDIITTTVNASTLKAVVKSMILQGDEVPEDLFKVTPFTRASITKR